MYGGTARLHEARGDPIDGASRRGHVRSGHRQQLTDNKVSIQSSQTPPVVGQSSNGSRTQQSDNTDRVSEAAGTSDKANDSKITLKKELNVISGTSVVIGLIIGSGIFITPNTILSHSHSFGFTMILWAAGGLVALFGGLCFCELAALVKRSGSTYAFILEGYSFRQKYRWLSPLGSLLAFLNIWSNTLIAQPTAIAVILLTFGRYLCRPFFISCSEVPIIPVKMFALFALCLITLINIYSVKWTARLMTILSSLKIVAMAVVVALGVWYFINKGCFSEDAKHPFKNTIKSPSNIALAFYGVMWAYDGWDAIFQVLEETKNTERTVVQIAFLGVPIVVLCYCVVNVFFFAVLSYEQIQSAEAVGLVFGEAVIGKAGLVVISLLVALTTFGGGHSNVFTAARGVFVSSRNGHLPEMFSGVHVTYRTPMPALLLQSFLASVMIAIGNIDQLIDAFSASAWLFYGLAIGALLIMRITHDDVPRSFEVWLLLPCFMLLVAAFLVIVPLWQNPVPQLMAFGGILLGAPVFVIFVMEKPTRIKPKLFDAISRYLTKWTNAILNTQTSKFIQS